VSPYRLLDPARCNAQTSSVTSSRATMSQFTTPGHAELASGPPDLNRRLDHAQLPKRVSGNVGHQARPNRQASTGTAHTNLTNPTFLTQPWSSPNLVPASLDP